MNETIVSPWVIYLIMESQTIGGMIFIISFTMAGLLWMMYYHANTKYKIFSHKKPHTEVEAEMIKKNTRFYRLFSWVFAFCCVVCALLAIVMLFIPSRDTLIMLYLNQFVTPENLDEAIKIINSMK